jgi:hypothetical protein
MKSALWPKGSIVKIYFIDGHMDAHEWVHSIVTEHIVPLLDPSWLRFEWGHLNPSFGASDCPIRISFNANDGAWSYLGTQSLDTPSPHATMNLGWLDHPSESTNPLRGTGTVVQHEFGHLLGMVHEHNSPNVRIQWRKQAVINELSGPPNNWDMDTINTNIFSKYDSTEVNGSEYDPLSIMHYYYSSSWICNADNLNLTLNDKLSVLDRQWISEMYSDQRIP